MYIHINQRLFINHRKHNVFQVQEDYCVYVILYTKNRFWWPRKKMGKDMAWEALFLKV